MASACMQACSSFSQRIELLREATFLELTLRGLFLLFDFYAVNFLHFVTTHCYPTIGFRTCAAQHGKRRCRNYLAGIWARDSQSS